MKKILILQNEIMEYRKPIYNALSNLYDVVILHSGSRSVLPSDRYQEIVVPSKKFGKFHCQFNSPISDILNEYDVAILMFDLGWPKYIAPLFYKNRPKIILWGHRYSKNLLACKLRDWLMSRADRLLLYGDEEIAEMLRRGVDSSKIRIAWNTVHVENKFDYSKFKKNNILFVGRLQPSKRIDKVIYEFANLIDDIPRDTNLEIVGSPAKGYQGIDYDLIELTRQLGINDRVIFHGRIDDSNELAKIFSRSYAYVSPSPVGLGVLHSFAYGVPVITLRFERHGPEFNNLEHMKNSIICNDIYEFSRAIKSICSNKNLAQSLGHNAYLHYTNIRSLDRMISGFVSAIEE
jgi:glycosyltransferase involved in cell wall biosynthesis